MLMASSMEPLHSFNQGNQNEATSLFWSWMQLAPALASCDANNIINAPLHSLGQNDQNEVKLNLFCCVTTLASIKASHDADNNVILTIQLSGHVMPLRPASVSHHVNDITAFLTSGQSK